MLHSVYLLFSPLSMYQRELCKTHIWSQNLPLHLPLNSLGWLLICSLDKDSLFEQGPSFSLVLPPVGPLCTFHAPAIPAFSPLPNHLSFSHEAFIFFIFLDWNVLPLTLPLDNTCAIWTSDCQEYKIEWSVQPVSTHVSLLLERLFWHTSLDHLPLLYTLMSLCSFSS